MDETKKLVNSINSQNFNIFKTKLNIRFHNPDEYILFLTKLRLCGLNKNVKVSLLGYPLKDKSEYYTCLENSIENPIEIIYDTCNDMISEYSKEPFHANSLYQSELEGGGKTDLKNYIEILNFLNKVEKYVKEKKYSPLEAAIYCQKFMYENYVYDPITDITDSFDYDTNRKLHNVVNRKYIVCVGYATLYSAMLRRLGIPVFCYSCDRHKQNIMRIKDEKYGIDCISTCDVTNDTSDVNSLEGYMYFMLSPKEIIKNPDPSFLTIPLSLVISQEDYEKYKFNSFSPYQIEFNPWYDPMGYTYRMLELMGYNIEESEAGLYDKITELNTNGTLDPVDKEKLKQAFITVTTTENPALLDNIDTLDEYFNLFMKYRDTLYTSDNKILINFPSTGEPYTVDVNLIDKKKQLWYRIRKWYNELFIIW